MHINECNPFILMKGTVLCIPSGIRSTGNRIPLRVVERQSDVYDFISSDSSEKTAMTLIVPDGTVPGKTSIKVIDVDFEKKVARSRIAE